MANRSYLKSQKLKEISKDHEKLLLLEKENGSLKKENASLEQKVKLPKEVIQKNRGNFLSMLLIDGTENQKKSL